jgi:two-component system nitrogen regulation response regulator NtrX
VSAPGTRTVLVVDDEKNIRRTLAMVLEGEGYTVVDSGNAEEGIARLGEGGVDVLLLDVKLPGMSGLEALEKLGGGRDVPVIMISGHATIDDAVKATKLGAFDFLEKPLDRERVLVSVRNALERGSLARELRSLRAEVGDRREMIGESAAIRALKAQIAKVAPTRGRVLVTGESGTGKELIARAIHRGSTVAAGEFVKVNCAAIPPELIESELFGHERGAFTGAVGKKRGLFEVADGGTLFLDEVGDMSPSAQAKVLRVLQTGELQRVGGERTIKCDARVVAATNRDLEKAVADGGFREDLYFRLNVIRLHAPPLRERAEDIPAMVEAFVAQCCRENGFREKPVTDDAMVRLAAYRWPGNVRELKNLIERAVILSEEAITIADLPDDLRPGAAPGGARPSLDAWATGDKTLREFRDDMEREFIRRKLEQYQWNISRTAEALGIERTNLHKKLRAFGIARGE